MTTFDKHALVATWRGIGNRLDSGRGDRGWHTDNLQVDASDSLDQDPDKC